MPVPNAKRSPVKKVPRSARPAARPANKARKSPAARTPDKGRARELVRRGSRDDKAPPVARRRVLNGTAACDHCGAVYQDKHWAQGAKVDFRLLSRADWTTCPACEQVADGEFFGRVVLRGAYVARNADAIRRRIDNVAERAAHTHTQRRIVEVRDDGEGLEVLTTSQKLAHRIVHELKKAFRGRASYAWADRDGLLYATWQRD